MISEENKEAILLSTAYLAPIQYYCKLISYKEIFIEYFENYSKQSFRNRCTILSANGPLSLTIPIKKIHTPKICIKDVQIDHEKRWKEIHLRAIGSAYRSSAFFLYYFDEISFVYQKNHEYLFDFNNDLQVIIMKFLGIEKEIKLTYSFKSLPFLFDDFADSIHPKKRMNKYDDKFTPQDYFQVFEKKFGFVPNLSIIDLLFNSGPSTVEILKESIK